MITIATMGKLRYNACAAPRVEQHQHLVQRRRSSMPPPCATQVLATVFQLENPATWLSVDSIIPENSSLHLKMLLLLSQSKCPPWFLAAFLKVWVFKYHKPTLLRSVS